MTRSLTPERVEREALCLSRRVAPDGITCERALMPDGRTLLRYRHPMTGMTSGWRATKDPFTPPDQWILGETRAKNDVFRTFEDTLAARRVTRGILLVLKVIGGLLAVVICYFLWVLIIPLFLCWLAGRAFPNRRHYSGFRRW